MKKILLVEDDTFIQDIVSQKLADAGYELKLLTRGDQVVSIVADFLPDLILLDIDLPGTDGFTVLSQLRAISITTPVIIFSNRDDVESKAKAKELGAQDFYFKAYTGADELLTKVALYL